MKQDLAINDTLTCEVIDINLIISQNDKLAKFIANKFEKRCQNHNLLFDDLYQAARIGLIKATRTYKKSYEVKWSRYATVCMEREIRDEIICMRFPIRIPRKTNERINFEEFDSNIYNEEKELLIDTSQLTKQDRNIIHLRFYKNFTNKQIGKIYHKSHEWARTKLIQILESLKEVN